MLVEKKSLLPRTHSRSIVSTAHQTMVMAMVMAIVIVMEMVMTKVWLTFVRSK